MLLVVMATRICPWSPPLLLLLLLYHSVRSLPICWLSPSICTPPPFNASSCYALRRIIMIAAVVPGCCCCILRVSAMCDFRILFLLSGCPPLSVSHSLTHSLTQSLSHSQTDRPNSTSLRKQSSPAALNDRTDRGPRVALRTSGPHLSTDRRRGAKNRGRGSWHRFKKKKNSPKKEGRRGGEEARLLLVTTGST